MVAVYCMIQISNNSISILGYENHIIVWKYKCKRSGILSYDIRICYKILLETDFDLVHLKLEQFFIDLPNSETVVCQPLHMNIKQQLTCKFLGGILSNTYF